MLRTAQLLIGRQIAQVLGTHPHARAIVARIDHLEDGTFTWSTGSCAPSSSTVSARVNAALSMRAAMDATRASSSGMRAARTRSVRAAVGARETSLADPK
jgi:hypothetical protein